MLQAHLGQRPPAARYLGSHLSRNWPAKSRTSSTGGACANMQGQLVKYGPGSAHTAFISGTPGVCLRHVVLVGGLTDGLLFAGYAEPLSRMLEPSGWCLVQPLLSSSYGGWGHGSLDQDADELLLLLTYLRDHSSQGVVILGHSTGCQNAVRYMARHSAATGAAQVLGVILQAPVSDREWFACDPETPCRTAAAHALVAAGKAEDIAFRDDEGTPVTARRWLSLATVGGDDDMFSSDFTAAQLREKLAHVEGTPALVMLSGADEYVPQHILEGSEKLAQRLAAAMGATASHGVIQGAKHDLDGAQDAGLRMITDFIHRLAL